MRKLLRSIARHNMQKAGIEQLNKKFRTEDGKKKSKFALYWRQFLTPQKRVKKRKNKRTPVKA